MTYICPECGQLKWDFAEFVHGAPRCAGCKTNMVPFDNAEENAKEAMCVVAMPGDDAYVVCC